MDNIVIAPDRIQIDGLDYVNLLGLEIRHKVNEHGYARIHVELEESDAKSFRERADESVMLLIKTTASEQDNKTLFCGYVNRVEVIGQYTHTEMIVELASQSQKLDITKRDKTFQNDGKTYKDIMELAAKDEDSVKTEIKMKASDRANGDWVIQYHETVWEFIKLEASKCKASVFTNILEKSTASISVGVPSASEFGKPLSIETLEYSNIADVHAAGKGAAVKLTTFLYGIAGTRITVNGSSYVIAESDCKLDTVGFRCTYVCKKEECFEVKEAFHTGLAGHMLQAEVKEVKNDTVKVYFQDIDKSYDGSTTKFFQYSTTYASSDGSGLYCMPEEKDLVRIFLPTNDERDGFAASSVNTNPLDKPRDKRWKAPGGKEILLTDEGIYIICEGEKVYINLTSEKGISIYSKNPIKVSSEKDVSIKADGKIEIESKKELSLKAGKAGIVMTKGKVVAGGDGVYVN